MFPQPTPQPPPPHTGYAQPNLPPTLPQPGAPVAGPTGVPTPETSRTAARGARGRSRTLIASAAAVVLLAAGGGITYALTGQEGDTTANGAQTTPPAVSSPAGSGPSSSVAPGASSKPSPSANKTGPTTTPGNNGAKPAESPSASPETKPSSTVKEPTPVSTACTGWSHENRSNGYGYLLDNSHLYTGPYAECSYVSVVKTGVKVYYHCYITNAYGNKWVYARAEGTNTEGWMSSTHLTRESGTLARC